MSTKRYSTDGPTCPYCGYTITPDEGWYFSDEYCNEECPDCEKPFKVMVFTETTWVSRPPNEEP